VAILGLESRPEKSRCGGGTMAVSGRLLAPMNLGPDTIRNLQSCGRVPALRPGGQKITLARLIIRNRTLKTIQRLSPEFHTIQILVQTLEGFGEVANDLVFRRFRHVIGLTRNGRVFAPRS
jgi:hypothetical protein